MPYSPPRLKLVIYLILNLVNGKFYIGQTKSGKDQRWNSHKHDALRGRSNTLLSKAIRKYGPDSFSISELEVCENVTSLSACERHWIQRLKSKPPNGYNLTDGGERPVMSDISRAKMSAKKLGIKTGPRPDWVRAKISAGHMGKKLNWTPEVRARVSEMTRERMLTNNPFKGKKHTEESLAKMSAAHLGTAIHSEAWKAELSRRMTGSGNPFFGKKHSPEIIEQIKRTKSLKEQT